MNGMCPYFSFTESDSEALALDTITASTMVKKVWGYLCGLYWLIRYKTSRLVSFKRQQTFSKQELQALLDEHAIPPPINIEQRFKEWLPQAYEQLVQIHHLD